MKQKRQTKRFFNLIEVSLAMSVIVIGVVGVMTILPYAMKSSTQTTRETYLADAATLIFAEIDRLAKDAEVDSDSAGFISMMTDGTALNTKMKVLSNYSNDTGCTIAHAKKEDYGLIRFYTVDPAKLNNRKAGANIKNGGTFKTDFANCFTGDYDGKIFAGLDETMPVFDAAYKITVTDIATVSTSDGELDALRTFESETEKLLGTDVRYPKPAVYGTSEMTDTEKKYWRRVYLEISWPTNREAKYRTKKLFVKEYYYIP